MARPLRGAAARAARRLGGMDDTLIDDLRTLPLWKDYRPTPLVELPALARHARVGRLFVKGEGERPLGNFKALGGMLAGPRAIARAVGAASIGEIAGRPLPRLVCASIEAQGGTIAWVDGPYDDAVEFAAAAAALGAGLLIADTSADPSDTVVRDVMAGYALLSRELVRQFADRGEQPSHLFVQAGVGGLAASMAQELHAHMRGPRRIVVVEPEAAACVSRALAAGRPVRVEGALATCAGMLSCGLASAPALEILLRHRVASMLVDEEGLRAAVDALREIDGLRSTPSGAAGLAGLLCVSRDAEGWRGHDLGAGSTVLVVATESGDVSR